MDDQSFDLSSARTIHSIDASRWLGCGRALWCEWDHPAEGARSFSDILAELERANWAQLIPPGSTCIDIGAHSADTTIPMGLFAFDASNRKKGSVYAVEPNPAAAAILDLNLGLNQHIANFSRISCAITTEDMDEVELADHGNSNCNGGIIGADYSSSLREKLEAVAGEKYVTKGRTLQSILNTMPESDARRLRFIKTDCEGYDKEILRSSKHVLAELRPTLFVEWFAWFTPEDDDDFFAAISEVGYRPLNPWTMDPYSRADARVPDLVCLPI